MKIYKILTFVSLLLAIVFINSCSSSNHFLKQGTRLSDFKYVYLNVIEDDYGLQQRVYNHFSNLGFDIVPESKVKNLPDLNKFLYCEVRYSFRGAIDASATIRLYDRNEVLLYSGIGSYGMGVSQLGDLEGAIDNAFAELSEVFLGNE